MSRRDFLRASAAGAVAAGVTLRSGAASGVGVAQTPLARPSGPAANRVRVGIIGMGRQGLAIARAVPAVPGLEVVAAADLYDGRLSRAGEILSDTVTRGRDWRPMLDRKDLDAVIVATPDHLHARVATAALQAGKDVYCECPIVHRPDEGESLVRLAAAQNCVLQGGGGWISSPVFAAARELIVSGRLGKVTLVRGTWDSSTSLGAWRTPFPPDASPESIDYAAFAGGAFDPARFFRWRCYRAYGSGLAGARFAPQLTAIHWLLGASKPSRVAATGALVRWRDGREVPDTMHASLDYSDGFTVVLSATQAGGNCRELSLVGTEATLSLDDRGFWIDADRHAEPYADVAESWPKNYRDWFYMMHGMTPQGQVRGTPAPEPSRERFDVPQPTVPAAAHLTEFVDAIRTRRAPSETADLAAGAASAAAAIDDAASGTEKR